MGGVRWGGLGFLRLVFLFCFDFVFFVLLFLGRVVWV